MHTEQCFPTVEQIYELLTDAIAQQAIDYSGPVCSHDDGFLCTCRALFFATRIYQSMPTCNPGNLDR